MAEPRYVVPVQRLVGQPVIAGQTVGLQSYPEIASVGSEQRLRATHQQLPSAFRQIIVAERSLQRAQVCYAVALGEHPQIALPVGMDIIAERKHSVVVFHLAAVHVNPGEPFQTAAPNGLAHGVFHQPVVSTEIIAVVIEQPHAGMLSVGRIVYALYAVLPRAYPQPALAVEQHGIDRVAGVQLRERLHASRLQVEPCKTLFPHADIDTSLPVFFERHHAAGHPVVRELVVCPVVAAGARRGARPYSAVACDEERVDIASLFALQVISMELSGAHIQAHQSVVGANPDAFVVVFSQRPHIVVGQNAWRIGVAAEVAERIAVVAQQSLFGAYPHHAVTVEQQAPGVQRTGKRYLRHHSQRLSLSSGQHVASPEKKHQQTAFHYVMV